MITEDLVGEKLGRLLVLKVVGKNKSNLLVLQCQCDCGNIVETSAKSIRSGHTRSCGCLHVESAQKTGHGNRIKEGEASFNQTYVSYKRQAKRRNHVFELTKEQFRTLTSSNCHYCGVEPKQTTTRKHYPYFGKYYYNGLDRVDSNLGYTMNNVFPCCKTCNVAKSDMTYEEFIMWVKRIYNNLSERSAGF